MDKKHVAKGFTIVELLIVIVVIGILATMTVVSYRGSQARARASKVKMNAESVKKVAESYYSQKNVYPTTVNHFSAAVTKLPAQVSLLGSGTLSSTNGENSILYKYVGTAPNATGSCIYYWDFAPTSGNPAISAPTYLGDATSTNCSVSFGAYPTP